MLGQKVISYIDMELEKGYTPRLITDVLVEKGFSKQDIESAVRKAQEKRHDEGKLTPEQKQEQKIRSMPPGESAHHFLHHLFSGKMHKPDAVTISYVLSPVCLVLLAGSVMSANRQLSESAHLFRSLFVLIAATFLVAPIVEHVGRRLAFKVTAYQAVMKFLFAAGIVFVFLEYFFGAGTTLLLLIPGIAVAALILRRVFVDDWTGAMLCAVITAISALVIVYALIGVAAAAVAFL